LLAALMLVATITESAGVSVTADALERTVRHYLIAQHCGLVTPEVMHGFRLQSLAMLSAGEISPAHAQQRRAAASEAVRLEWRNRGMGEQDPRCDNEGRAAAARFVQFLRADE